MLRFLDRCWGARKAWFLVATTTFMLEMVALWFQYVMEFKPCVLCIYERCALFGIMGAGLIGAIAPKTLLRYAAIAIWLYSAWKGVILSLEHITTQLHISPFMTCNFTSNLPSWLPLDKWLPQIFLASSSCSIQQWEFLTLNMPQWLVGIFMVYFIVALLLLISQLFKLKKRNLFEK